MKLSPLLQQFMVHSYKNLFAHVHAYLHRQKKPPNPQSCLSVQCCCIFYLKLYRTEIKFKMFLILLSWRYTSVSNFLMECLYIDVFI